MTHSIIPVFVPHLGCPHNCVFCNQRKIAGTLSAPTPDGVRLIIEDGLKKAGRPAELAFYGGSFTAVDKKLQTALLGAAQPFLDAGDVSGIRVSTRPDCIDGEILETLKKYGVKTVELGAQSTDDEVLRLSGRGHTKKDISDASKLIKNAGLNLILQVMCGLPGDTREKDIKTAKDCAGLNPDGARIYPVVVLEDTPLYDRMKEGRYRPITVSEACDTASGMLEVFEDADIPVIRIGLNASDELSNGAAVAGAYHPALGEMARSRLYLKRAEALLSSAPPLPGEVILGVNKSCLSLMAGQKKENRKKLAELYPDIRIKIKAADVSPGKVIIM
ncbi:MAG: radical SAM protein [Bacillota bacterium]|nr:radical SAM protein [Bacillota bacterium]